MADDDSSDSEGFKCSKCPQIYSRKANLKLHLLKVHGEKLDGDKNKHKTTCIFSGCEEQFFHKTKLFAHMEKDHDANIESENHDFSSFDEFLKWKEEVEGNQHLYFSKQFRSSSSKLSETSHYLCQRDGNSKPHRKSGELEPKTTKRNKKGRVKADLLCPARMKVLKYKDNGAVSVTYWKSHNHLISPRDIQHHPLPATEKENIKTQLSVGVPVETIFKELRECHGSRDSRDDEFTIKKKHFVDKRQIKEMARKLKVNRRLHPDDAMSVYLIVQQLMQEKYNSVLLYKPENGEVVLGPELPADELFLLSYMTKEQEMMLKKNASQILCVDSTHETNQYKFKLITVLVPDEFGRGYPVAHLITNREDTEVMSIFFQAIKDRVGDIRANALMTDDDSACYNGYKAVFGEVRHFLCKWHIHRAWCRKLRHFFAGNTSLQTEIYQMLVTIMDEKSSTQFVLYVEKFKEMYGLLYPDMVNYLQTYYLNRCEKWAMCYRNFPHAGTDTNMFLESYHNRLKTFYLNRKKNKRIDDLLNVILQIEEDDYWRHKKDFFFSTSDVSPLADGRHHRGMAIPNADVHEECDGWKVLSRKGDGLYFVTKQIESCTMDHCFSKCLEVSCLGLCGHLYHCTCKDSSDICKHIHKVHSLIIGRELAYNMKKPCVGKDHPVIFQAPDESHVADVEAKKKKKDDDLSFIHNQLETIRELSMNESVQALLLPHVKAELAQLIMKCKAVTSCQENAPKEMEVTDPVKPNQNLSYISKMKRKRKPKKESQPFEKKKIIESLNSGVRCDVENHDNDDVVMIDVEDEMVEEVEEVSEEEVVSESEEEVVSESEEEVVSESEEEVVSDSAKEVVIDEKENSLQPETPKQYGDRSHSKEALMGVYGHELINCNPTDTIFRNAEFNLSLVTLKSLETDISKQDLTALKNLDPSFRTGWLVDEVVDSFLWNLQLFNPAMLLVPTTVMLHVQHKGTSLRLLWKGEDMSSKEWVIAPWNQNGNHWILSAFHFHTNNLFIIDPMSKKASLETCTTGLEVISRILMTKFQIKQEAINLKFPKHTLQNDASSCGVMVCWYAQQLIENGSLACPVSTDHFRYQIFKTIVGSCLYHDREGSGKCPFCNNYSKDTAWIQCDRCDQWFHCGCVNFTPAQADNIIYFFCPR